MSHQSGITATNELLDALAEAKNGALRLVHMQIEDEQIKLRGTRPVSNGSNWEADYDEMVLPLLDKTIACYLLFRLDSKNNLGYQWILLTWIPDEAHVWQKTLYASSRTTLRRQFGDGYLSDDLLCHDKSDINLNGYRRHLASKDAPLPLSFAESQMSTMKSDNLTHCSYSDGHSSFNGISFPLNNEASAAIDNFKGGSIDYVQLQIDMECEMIKLATTAIKMEPETIASMVSANSGSYHLYRFKHTHEGAKFANIFFIHAIAGYQSAIKERMLYSSCKGTLIDILTRQYHLEIEHKLEVDDFKELTTGFFLETAHPKTVEAPSLVLPKPRGPGGRGPRRIIK